MLRASIGLRFSFIESTLLACCLGPCDWRGGARDTGNAAPLMLALHNLAAVDWSATTWVVAFLSLLLGLWIAAFVQERRHAARATAFQTAAAHYQRFLRQVIDTNPNLIFVKDWEGKYVLANEAMAQFHGTTVETLIGKRDSDFGLKDGEVERFLRADREVLSTQLATFIPEEQATCTRTGATRWFQTVKVPLLSPDGSARQVLGVATDITERKQLEDQFRQAHKMEAVGRLAGGIAHDFNNVLTIVRAQTEFLLADMPADDVRRADVLEIQSAADRAAGFIRQLLAFSRRQLLQPEVLELNAVITGMESMVRRLVGEDVVLLTKLHPELPRVWADPGQLQQVVLNLAVNARDAMPRGGTLLIETGVVELDEHYPRQHPSARPGRHVVLVVTDTGCGMDPATRSRIFEPFFTTKEPGKGTGLGLSTVYGIVKQTGGHIWVYSEVGRGTTFKLYFPLHQGPMQASERTVRVLPPSGAGATDPRGRRRGLGPEYGSAPARATRVPGAGSDQRSGRAGPDHRAARRSRSDSVGHGNARHGRCGAGDPGPRIRSYASSPVDDRVYRGGTGPKR